MIFIDGDFLVKDSKCEYYCSPTCHPAQIGPEWVYGCLHKAWPQNKIGDFCPIVMCEGDPKNCQIPINNLINMRRGFKIRVSNAEKKIKKYTAEIKKLNILIETIKKK